MKVKNALLGKIGRMGGFAVAPGNGQAKSQERGE